MRLTKTFGTIAILSGALVLAACGAPSPGTDEQPSEAATEPATAPATPAQTSGALLAGSPTPGAANVEVTPAEATIGPVTMTLTLQPARHMFDQAMTTSADAAAPQPQTAQDKAKNQQRGSAVLGGGMLKVANNIDAAQNPPADSAQGIVRHVVVQVKDTASGQLIPYLSLSMDVLLDGRPTIFDQALAPMVSTDSNPAQLYYGNNVKFPQRGTYQVFVRLQPHPLLGQDQPPAAQFNLVLQ